MYDLMFFLFKIEFLVVLPCLEFSLVHSSHLDLYYECTFYGDVMTLRSPCIFNYKEHKNYLNFEHVKLARENHTKISNKNKSFASQATNVRRTTILQTTTLM